MYSRMLNSFGASSMASPPRVTLRRMQSRTRSPTCRRSGVGLPAAQQRADARQQFDERERLDQIIVGAEFQTFDAVVHRAARAEDQHRRAGLAVADLLEDLQPVHVGQHHVQDDQIVIGRVNQVDRRLAVSGGIDRIAGALQAALQEIGNSLFVFNDKKAHSYFNRPKRGAVPAMTSPNLSEGNCQFVLT